MQLNDEQHDWLTLTLIPGLGSSNFIKLLARFKTPSRILRASEAELREICGPKLAERITQYKSVVDVPVQLQAMKDYDVNFITLNDAAYPARLAEIHDPPLALFVRGDLREEDQHCVAIVGTRKASAYGLRMAEQLAHDLAARGITIVSGMATGIDSAAHEGALKAGGRTIAILAGGVDIVFPAENAALMHKIIQQGAVISQFPMGMPHEKGLFPYRNRIVSGISMGVVIVEAPPQSGALITAQLAAEQGREVFALPGQVGFANSKGPHSLIREGAKLIESVDDILLELELPSAMYQQPLEAVAPNPSEKITPELAAKKQAPAAKVAAPTPPNVSAQEKDVLSVLALEGSFVDEIAMACRITVSEALSSLTMLELKGLVRQFSGKRFAPR